VPAPTIPLTVVGGYLGAGKTTVVNHLLRHPGGRRIGVIVNDFGSLAVDAGLLADAAGDDLVSLPNGCVCCTVGAGLHEALGVLADRVPRLDQVVIEVSGVADPAAAAAWGTVPPFEPAGVIVLADVTTVRQRSRDRYVGAEVLRQLRGADLVMVTKSDLCDGERLLDTERWLEDVTGGVPSIRVVDGRVPTEVVLGIRSEGSGRELLPTSHDERYVSWSWTSSGPVSRRTLDRFLDSLGPGILRLKGRVHLDGGSWVVVQAVGHRVDVAPSGPAERSELVAIAVRTDPPAPDPFALHFG
jgi:G3E family GTPase